MAHEAKEQRITGGEDPGCEAQKLVVPGQCANFAGKLLALFAEQAVSGDGCGLEDNALAGPGDVHGNKDIVQDGPGGNFLEEVATDGVDGSCDSDDGTGRGFELAHDLFDLPINPQSVGRRDSGFVFQEKFAAYSTHVGVGEAGDQF